MRAIEVWFIALLAVAAWGCRGTPDSDELGPATELSIVAHQDDDLLFMQPDLGDGLARNVGVVTLYVTAGNGRGGIEEADKRNAGLRAAYSHLAGPQAGSWRCGWIAIAGRAAEHCRLEAARVSLVFLGYPDGGKEGESRDSLLHLWEGKIDRADTVARRVATYDRQGLVEALAEVIDTVKPRLVRTLEVAATHGRDHADHMIVGAATVLAAAAARHDTEVVSYRGYGIDGEPENAEPTRLARSTEALRRYAACAEGCAPCGQPCPALSPQHDQWHRRRYAIGMVPRATGKLQLGARCLGAGATFAACDGAPRWQLERGSLASGGGCLEVLPAGELRVTECRRVPAQRFALDDDGHLWSGLPPVPEADMAFAHLRCIADVDGVPRAVLCGGDRAPAWRMTRAMVATPRTVAGLAVTGRALQLGELGLCAITGGRLACAKLAADGVLAPAAPVDAAAAPLAVEPYSLVLGDVDGDRRPDACGRDAGGVLCATAANEYRAERWTSLFGGKPGDHSLWLAAGGRMCVPAGNGIRCAARGASAIEPRLATVDTSFAAWLGDLDGDGEPDGCFDGPRCALAGARAASSWAYSSRGWVQTMPRGFPGLVALTDTDGDGRTDLCTVDVGIVQCARSLAHGFGPRRQVASLPAGMTPAALWAHGSSICAADETQIACTR